jgi:hypothetical protein
VIRRADRRVDERGGMDYLGPEFLTWLVWRASTAPEFKHPDGTAVYVHVDDHLELRGERGAAKRTSLRAGMPAASAEGKAALRHGKVVVTARVILARGDQEATLTLRGEDLDVSGARLPAAEGATAEERLEAALDAARRVWEDVDLCYASFLDVRCSPRWDAEAESVRAWVAAPSEEERSFA